MLRDALPEIKNTLAGAESERSFKTERGSGARSH